MGVIYDIISKCPKESAEKQTSQHPGLANSLITKGLKITPHRKLSSPSYATQSCGSGSCGSSGKSCAVAASSSATIKEDPCRAIHRVPECPSEGPLPKRRKGSDFTPPCKGRCPRAGWQVWQFCEYCHM